MSGAAFLLLTLLSACALSPDSFGGSREAVLEWANARGFEAIAAKDSRFALLALRKGEGSVWNVYIEGDGAPWLTPYHPPADPTPQQPLALALAARDPAPAVAYLGRPGQYPEFAAFADCPPEFWTRRRFSAEVINAYQQQLDAFKARFGVIRFRLVGYSGGGVIASLLAAQRDDVERLLTVAAPLSLQSWLAHHALSPMPDALDPATQISPHQQSAWHFGGGKDKVVPFSIIQHFVSARGGQAYQAPDFDHQCCWSRDWPKLLEFVR